MNYLTTYDYLSSNLLLDFGNFFACLIFIFLCQKYFNIKKIHVYFLILHSLLPFFINDFFMNYSYMPDQTRYIFYSDIFRNYEDQKMINYGLKNFDNSFFFSKTSTASYLLSLVPVPNTMTIRSLGFANKILFIVLFSYLYKKKILGNYTAYIYLVYPSYALYSGIALKEMLCFMIMILSIEKAYNYNLRNFFYIILLCLITYLVKFQHLVFMLPIIIILILNIGNFKINGYGKSVYIIFIIFGLVGSSLFFNFYKEEFNNIRLSFFVDDGNITENYNYIDNYLEFLKVSIVEITRGLVYPLPAFDGNIYRKFQFLENVLVIFTIIFILFISLKKDFKRSFIWVIFLFYSMALTSMVVENIGTLSRYKFSIILTYLIFIFYSSKYEKKN